MYETKLFFINDIFKKVTAVISPTAVILGASLYAQKFPPLAAVLSGHNKLRRAVLFAKGKYSIVNIGRNGYKKECTPIVLLQKIISF